MLPTNHRTDQIAHLRHHARARVLALRVALGATLLGSAAGCSNDPVALRADPGKGPNAVIICDEYNPDCNDRPPRPPTVRNWAYGINANSFAADPGSVADAGRANAANMLGQAGIRWARVDVNWFIVQDGYSVHSCNMGWGLMQPNRDPSTWQWDELDRTVQRAAASGMQVLAVIAYPPPSESSVGCGADASHYTPRDIAGWTNFVQAVVARYPQVKAWGIWNEVNTDFFKVPAGYGQTRAQAYASLINAAAPIIRQAGAKVVAVDAINNPGEPWCAGCVETQTWVRDVMRDAGNNVDIASLHFYPAVPSTMRDVINTTVNTMRSVSPYSPALGNVWVTETAINQNNPSESVQSSELSGVLSEMVSGRAPAWKGTFYWHAYAESPNPADENRGILRGVGANAIQPKLAYNTYAQFISAHP